MYGHSYLYTCVYLSHVFFILIKNRITRPWQGLEIIESTAESTEQEVNDIKANFKEYCRVLRDIGDFKFVVDITLNGKEVALKFQIEGMFKKIIFLF